jgi:hypothetical protein
VHVDLGVFLATDRRERAAISARTTAHRAVAWKRRVHQGLPVQADLGLVRFSIATSEHRVECLATRDLAFNLGIETGERCSELGSARLRE